MRARTTVDWPRLIGAVLLCEGAGAVGALFTSRGLQSWYPSLRKPSFTPPGAAFGPVWTTLYAMMGIAVYLATRGTQAGQESGSSVARARGLFGLQLGLNALWSILFFGLRSPLAALVDLVALWVAILLTIVAFARRSRVAAALMGPYLAWTTFAGVLNAAIWWLNRDQPGS